MQVLDKSMSKTIEILNRAEQAGLLKPMVQNGIISPTVLEHKAIYEYVQKEAANTSKKAAVISAMQEFKACERKVYDACKRMGS